jgi:hypothetical protein
MTSTTPGLGPVAAVQRLYKAFARRDLAGVLAWLAEDVVWSEPANPYNPAAGTRRGHAGFLEWAKAGNESEEILGLEPRQFLSAGDCVAVVGHTRCRARVTGRIYETDFVHLVTFTDGKVSSFQEFFDTFAAAEAFKP